MKKAQTLLKSNLPILTAMVEALLERETLEASDVALLVPVTRYLRLLRKRVQTLMLESPRPSTSRNRSLRLLQSSVCLSRAPKAFDALKAERWETTGETLDWSTVDSNSPYQGNGHPQHNTGLILRWWRFCRTRYRTRTRSPNDRRRCNDY